MNLSGFPHLNIFMSHALSNCVKILLFLSQLWFQMPAALLGPGNRSEAMSTLARLPLRRPSPSCRITGTSDG
ncbi:hypothetical protein T11_12303 [Trichinella zimbabwensis]|uniref:Uncharacterized protein n=1 Tax=Trichinella zimbabwensis TaxID=268475 RepID=A0A0V1GV70_9BILA|nr:hypothetical protein T11_12303 [Trichinella zimbabwensis]